MEQWSELGSSSLEAANAQAPHHTRGGVSSRHRHGPEYSYADEHEDDHSNDGYMSSSSSSSSGGSISSTSSHSSDDDDYDDDDDNMRGDIGSGGGGGQALYSSGNTGDDGYDSQEDDVSSASGLDRKHSHYQDHPGDQFDYYGNDRHGTSNHDGFLPAPPEPAMVSPLSDREILEQEARRRRWERHADKRRKSLNGANQAPPPDRFKKTDPLVLEMIREEAEKERRRQCGQDNQDEEGDEEDDEDEDEEGDEEEDEEDEEEYDDDDDDEENDTETKDQDSDEGSDEDDQEFDSVVLHESDDDDDNSQQYDIYENYDQQLHQEYKYQTADGSQYDYYDQRTTAETAPSLEALGLDSTKYSHGHPPVHVSDFIFNNTLHDSDRHDLYSQDSNGISGNNNRITGNFAQDGTQQLSSIRHTIKDATSSMVEPTTATEPGLSFHFMPSATEIAASSSVRTIGSDTIHEPKISLRTIPKRLTTYWKRLKQVPLTVSPSSPSPSPSTSSSSTYYSCPSISEHL
ncbi:hypothetical protein BGZ50_008558 [Haplosporangium sp. Z 11]|nr:hypothetical protein BGZ50_008558 [Haplosporangium sp. Z 11]